MASTTRRSVPADDDCCWICLRTAAESGEELAKPCACPRLCHMRCLARWQLQSAGKDEEAKCRFCHTLLPTWHSTLAPDVKPIIPVMAIKFEGKTYKLKVKPGPDGLAEFQAQVRELLGFDISEDFDVTFECSVNGEKMKLSGLNSYGAATHCAAITAAQREDVRPRRSHRHHHHHRSNRTTQAASAPAPADVSAPKDMEVESIERAYRHSAVSVARPRSTGYMPAPSTIDAANAACIAIDTPMAEAQQQQQQSQPLHVHTGTSSTSAADADAADSPASPSTSTSLVTCSSSSLLRRTSSLPAGEASPCSLSTQGSDSLPLESASGTFSHTPLHKTSRSSAGSAAPAKRTIASSLLTALGLKQ